MKVIVDTCVWSLALRRSRNHAHLSLVKQLKELIVERRIAILGTIRQEILSGIATTQQFETLKNYLRAFPDMILTHEDYEHAAHCYNCCRTKGIQGSNTDFLICAVAVRQNMAILTTDKDFHQFSKIIPIKLWIS